MAGSGFGNYFTCTAWGDAYTQGIGAVVDGVPAGLKITENDIQQYLNRRRVWAASVPAKRHESDFVTIASGLENGITTGGPVSLTIMNSAVKEKGEAPVPGTIRPGQGDIAMAAKYGATSEKVMLYPSRIQSAITAAGAIAVKILKEIGVSFCTYVSSVGPVSISYANCSVDALKKSPLLMPDPQASAEALEYAEKVAADHDSAGSTVEVVVTGMPAGVGEPLFGSLSAQIASAIMSIESVAGVEFGDGIKSSTRKGSEDCDSFAFGEEIKKLSNHSGGIEGGMSDGSEIVVRASLRPDPWAGQGHDTVNVHGTQVSLPAREAYDVVTAPRLCVVIESVTAIAIVDSLFENMSAKIENVKKFYEKA